MKRAALLLRCSTSSQDFNRQKTDLELVAHKFGFTIVNVFGEYVTGKDDIRKGNRESVDQLLNACNDNKIDVVLISEVSRLTRNFLYGVTLIDKFNRDYNIPLYFKDKRKWTIDLQTGKINEEFEKELRKAFEVAEEELKSIRYRFASGKRDTAGMGKMFGSRPAFGYTKDKNGYLIIKEDEAAIVKDIYNKYLENGNSLMTVSLYVRNKYPEYQKIGITGTIRHILRRESYTGKLKLTVKDEIEDYVDEYYIDVPVIIDTDTFKKVNDKLSVNRIITAYPKATPYTLQKLIKCDCCNSFYTRSKSVSRNTVSFKCTGRTTGNRDCNVSISLREELLEPIIWNYAKESLFCFTDMNNEKKEEAVNDIENRIRTIDEDISLHSKEVERINKRLTNLEDLFLDGDISKDKYRQRKVDIDSNLNDINYKINKLVTERNSLEANKSTLLETNFSEKYIEEIENDILAKQKLLREHIKEIYPYKMDKFYVIKVVTLFGVDHILYNARSKNRKAAYISTAWAYKQDDCFLLPQPSMLKESEELEEYVTAKEMYDICITNNSFVEY